MDNYEETIRPVLPHSVERGGTQRQLIGTKASVLANWSELSAGCGVATLKDLGIHREA